VAAKDQEFDWANQNEKRASLSPRIHSVLGVELRIKNR